MPASPTPHQAAPTLRHRIEVLIIIFMIGGVVGFLYEELFYRINDGFWSKRGSTLGPWVTIYGVGALLILAITHKVRSNPILVFLISTVTTGALEFIVGHYLWTFHGVRLWDYNTEIWNWGNIGGYVCARSYLLFGLMGLLLQFGIRPGVERIADRLKPTTLTIVAWSVGGLFVVDLLATALLTLS